ncbi:Uncharacterized conserved protein [Cognatiyoonia koreensis]|uniref:Uncharacterized conserved protein n=1 Tax=Cognatiyoonia koreensis TaxID=364200 RepID=A0A1I0MLQ4_9RHOB|nr:extensin family protein [Cognatiyoonia koreensis]SEV88815.1 Uncharacterized conserved protein [Cognatiyoonia koreensis]
MTRFFVALALCALGSSALAQDQVRPQARPLATEAISTRTSPISLPTRPLARPAAILAFAPSAVPLSENLRPTARPFLRPELAHGAQTQPQLRAERNLFAFSPTAPVDSLRPIVRPAAFVVRAEQQRVAAVRGQVCGNPQIQGKVLGAVPGRGACGIDQGVQVRSVSGVALSPAATIDCRTAGALNRWVRNTARPAVGDIGGGISSLRVVSHYSCRNRNSASSGRLSEHSFGRAIDIAGIRTKSGREITVLTDWGRGAAGAALRQMWRGACGPFGTVLGPEANRYHRDHFHFDTARYRSGSYCR